MKTLVVIRIGLAAKISKVLKTLASLYCSVALVKIKYLVVTPGIVTPPEPLLVISLLALYLKIKI